MILAGDIGGTNTRIAAYELSGEQFVLRAEATFPSQRYASLEEVVALFLEQQATNVSQACFGLAGPVREERCATTNLAWIVDGRRLIERLGIGAVWLINDLEATGYGLDALGDGELVTLQEGMPLATGNAAIVAAGTGLGEAGLYWDGRMHRPFATEGGHTDFAPADELQIELLRFLQAEVGGRVSWERVVSGPGLVSIHRFLTGRGNVVDPALVAEMGAFDPAAAIARAALAGRSELAVDTLDLFCSLYGAEAGNVALKLLAAGGVFLAGGIAPKILPFLQRGGFLRAFGDKGRMAPLLEAMPVRVVTNERIALLGAARCAALRSGLIEGER